MSLELTKNRAASVRVTVSGIDDLSTYTAYFCGSNDATEATEDIKVAGTITGDVIVFDLSNTDTDVLAGVYSYEIVAVKTGEIRVVSKGVLIIEAGVYRADVS